MLTFVLAARELGVLRAKYLHTGSSTSFVALILILEHQIEKAKLVAAKLNHLQGSR